MTKQLHVFQTT